MGSPLSPELTQGTAWEKKMEGYGIGLFFAKIIVEKHGGHISVHSELGNGSTFTIER